MSPWTIAAKKFRKDRFGLLSLILVGIYFCICILVWFGILGTGWETLHEESFGPPSEEFWFGTNINGQDIFARTIYSTKTAFEVGLLVAFCSIILGVFFGSLAGYFHGRLLDEVIIWFYGCLDSIPFYLFVAAIAVIFKDFVYAMHVALIATMWTSTGKVVRGQVIKLKFHEFIDAARAVGASDLRIIVQHILPNLVPLLLIELSISFITAIKAEAILSFLGLGIKDSVSWGTMLAEASAEVSAGILNNFLAASVFMFGLVMAFNQLADALQDALDPKKAEL